MPIFELDRLDHTTVKDLFDLHCDKINQTLRRHWFRQGKNDNVTRSNWKNTCINQYGLPRMRNVLFNAARYLPSDLVNFPLLTTFLVVSEVTGSVHLFRIKNQPDGVRPETKFYPKFVVQPFKLKRETAEFYSGLPEGPICATDRNDTAGYIRDYITHAYDALGY